MNKQINLLIVEDELLLANDLQFRLEITNNFRSVIAQSFDDAIKILITSKIDFLIIDISLKGTQTGIDLAKKVDEKFNLPYVFLTSHADNETFDKAKEANPYAYILKPFNDRMLAMSIELAISQFNKDQLEKQKAELALTEKEEPLKDIIFLKKDNSYHKVHFNDFIYLEANSNYTLIHTVENDYVYSVVLKKFQEKLDENLFLRIHRSYIINVNYVTSFENNSIVLDHKHKLPISKQNKDLVFKRFQTI